MGERLCARIAMLATLTLWLLSVPVAPSMAEGATHGDLVQARFQQLLDQWGYHEWWSIWEQGTNQSRSAISKDAFANRMEASSWQLACCDKRLRNLQIGPISSDHVVVSATLLFETKGIPRSVKEQLYSINLHFYLEEGQWRVDLSGVNQP
jgi:hypothetical protein